MADGKTASTKYSYPAKGGPVTFLEGVPPANGSEIRNIIDDHTMEEVTIRDGKVVAKARYVLSGGGTTVTLRRTGTTREGKPFEFIAVYEKQ